MNHRAPRPIVDSVALVESIRDLLVPGHRCFIGVVGAPGAGKTHLTRFLQREVSDVVVSIVPMDGFHLANDVLEALGRRQYKGRPDTFDVAGFLNLLDRLEQRETGPVYAPRFVREIEEPIAGSLAVPADAELVIVEGNYLLVDAPPWDAVAPRLAATYYLDTPEPVRMERLLVRHRRTYGQTGAADWIERVDRPNSAIVEATRPRADVLVAHFEIDGEPLH